MGNKQRNENPSRYRAARNDATIGSVEKTVEKMLNLPNGSVQIRNTDGRNTRSDKKVENLRKDYGKS